MSMLVMTSVIVKKCVSICFLTLYSTFEAPPNVVRLKVTSPTIPLDGPRCVNKALCIKKINASTAVYIIYPSVIKV